REHARRPRRRAADRSRRVVSRRARGADLGRRSGLRVAMEFLTSRRAGHAPAERPLRLLEERESRPAVVASAYGHRDFWTRRFLAGADAVALIIALAIS